VAHAAAGPDAVEDTEHEVLGGHVGGQITLDRDGHRLGPLLRQRLRREDVLDLARADAEGQSAEGAVGRGVGVAAHDHHPRLRETHLRPDDVHDPLPDGAPRVQPDAELLAVLPEGLHLLGGDLILDRQTYAGRRDVVVHRREREVRPAYPTPREPQALEGLRGGHFVHHVQIHVEEIRLPLGSPHHVPLPHLLYQRLRFVHTASFWAMSVFHRSVAARFGSLSTKRDGRSACTSNVRADPSTMISARR
jgi:hypothetical protein